MKIRNCPEIKQNKNPTSWDKVKYLLARVFLIRNLSSRKPPIKKGW